MRTFLRTYRSLFLILLPLLFIMGQINEGIAYVLVAFFALAWGGMQKRGHLIFLFLGILILGDRLDEPFSVFKVMRSEVLVIMFLWTIRDLVQGRKKVESSFWWILPFIILSFVSSFVNSPTLFYSIQKTISYLLVVFVCFHYIVPWLKRKSHFQDLLHFIGLLALLCLCLYLLMPENVFLGDRFKGVFGNPNGMGLSSMLWIPILYIGFRKMPKRKSWWFYLAFVILCLLMSQSRNSLLGVSLFFGLLYILRSRKRRRTFFIAIPITYLIIISVDWIELIKTVGLGDYLRVEGIETASGRTLSWAFALTIIPQNLLLGGGFGYQEYAYQELVPVALQNFRQMGSTWNSYLTLLLNNGVLGLGAFLVFIYAQAGYAISNWKKGAYITAILLGAVFETWLTASLNAFTIYFFITLGYLTYQDPL